MVSLSKKLQPKENSIPKYLVISQSLSSIAPLGSVSAYLTFALIFSLASTGLASIVGMFIYLLWVIIGYRYSKVIASTGGTYEFARQASGETIGSIAGWLYWISYAIYLPSVTTYLVGIVLPTLLNLPSVYLSIIEAIIPLLLTLLMISGIKPPLFYSLISSTIEVILIVILGIKVLMVKGFSLMPFYVSVPQYDFWSGALAVAFTLAGGGASFFLGYEAKGKGKTVGSSYLIAFMIASIAVIFASYYEIAAAGYSDIGVSNLLNVTEFPGFYISEKFMGSIFASIIFVFTVNSLLGSAIAAYVALSRLTFTLVSKNMLKSILIVFVFFLIFNLFGSITGQLQLIYYFTTQISLITLFVSHSIVSAVYPFFVKKISKISVMDILLALLSSGIMVYGIYSNLIPIQFTSIISIGVILFVIVGVIIYKRIKREKY
jgi:amino acid transporter